MGFVPMSRRAYVWLQSTLLATSVILLALTMLFQFAYGELSPWLKASQLMLAIGAFAQALELVQLARNKR
jgi:hypothetical protein